VSERRVTTTVDLSGFLGPLLILCGVPALLILALLVGQVVIYGGWR
jgi:hypothetical protein